MTLPALVLSQLGWLVLLGATAWALGWVAWARRRPERLLDPLTAILGLALLGETALVLAALHWFAPLPLVLVVVAVHGAALSGWRRLLTAARERPQHSWIITLLALVLASGGSFLIALYPPTGFDETTYHLPLARAFTTTGALPWVPELRVPAFPMLAEALQGALLLGGGERAAHLVALLATLLTAALLVTWGREAAARECGWLAAALYLGSPLVAYLGGTGYVDTVLACFATASFYALWRAGREATIGWAPTAGFLAGAAAAVKYLGLYCVLAGAVTVASGRPRWRRLVAFGATALTAVAVAYGYLWWRTGNPLFPYFGELFGTGWPPIEPPATNLGRVLRTLLLPWNAVFHRDLAGQLPPLSPALLLSLPLLGWDLARARRLRAGATLLLGYWIFLMVTPGSAHYLLPGLPLWALLTAVATLETGRAVRGAPLSRAATALLAVALVLPGTLYGVFWISRAGSIPTSLAGREAYLAAVHPGYALLAWADAREARGAVVYGLDCEHLHAFARGRLLGEWQGPYAFARVRPWLADPPRLHAELRAMGAQYLLLPHAQAAGLRDGAANGQLAWLRADDRFELWQVR